MTKEELYFAKLDILKKKKRLMFVDDDPSIRNIFELWMGQMYKYSTINNGKITEEDDYNLLILLSDGEFVEEEMNILKKYDILPHFILLDIKMPLKNGKEVCKWLRSKEEYSSIPTYFYSAYLPGKLERLREETGADGAFSKSDMRIIGSFIEKKIDEYQKSIIL